MTFMVVPCRSGRSGWPPIAARDIGRFVEGREGPWVLHSPDGRSPAGADIIPVFGLAV